MDPASLLALVPDDIPADPRTPNLRHFEPLTLGESGEFTTQEAEFHVVSRNDRDVANPEFLGGECVNARVQQPEQTCSDQ
jgi:hypothetical protein